MKSKRKICGESMERIDIIKSNGIGYEWKKYINKDEGREYEKIFEFEGER